MQKEYYPWYYRIEREHWWFQVRNEILKNLVRDFSGKQSLKILNVGVATGYTTEMLQEFGDLTSVEYDKDCYDYLQSFLPGKIVNASITELPFSDNEFDIVCAFDVLEHVQEDREAVRELNRVCKKNGTIIVSVPAYRFLWSEHDIINHHVTRYTEKELLNLFSRNKIVYSSYFNFFLFIPIALVRVVKTLMFGKPKVELAKSDFKSVEPTIISRILKFIFSCEKLFINRRISLPFGVSIILVAAKHNNEQ